MIYCIFVILALLMSSPVTGLAGFGGIELGKKRCFQHCDVILPSYYKLNENVWVWDHFPGYCVADRIPTPGAAATIDSSCVSSSTDGVNYCDLSQKAMTRQVHLSSVDQFIYRCNVYNSTTGTFFYTGRIWPDYATC